MEEQAVALAQAVSVFKTNMASTQVTTPVARPVVSKAPGKPVARARSEVKALPRADAASGARAAKPAKPAAQAAAGGQDEWEEF